ncbi:5612_t:CDS:2, partial [Funneliformis geosporum]
MNTILRNTEPNKQSSWILNTFKQYEDKCKRNEITPTHIKYMQKILESLKVSTTIAQAQWVERKPQDAYFAEAEVFGKRINVMIDTGAVGCIITKSFLDSVNKEIEASTNVQIVSVTGAKTAPLGKMFKVGVKIGKFEIKEDMIVTEASGYNVLLGNDWITNQAKAIINTEKQIMIIKQNKEIDTVPITCFTKINPEILSPIDFFEEEYDELELEDIEGEPQHYLNVSLEENIAIINHQRYPTEFLEFSDLEFQRTDKYWKGPGRCLCKLLQNNEKCSFCQKLYEDLEDYRVAKAQIEEDDELIEITKGKDAPIGNHSALQWLLNSDSKVTENKRIMRWRLTLQEYKYEVKYRKGKNHENADALSWINPHNLTQYLTTLTHPFNLDDSQRIKLQKISTQYMMKNNLLHKRSKDGDKRVIL